MFFWQDYTDLYCFLHDLIFLNIMAPKQKTLLKLRNVNFPRPSPSRPSDRTVLVAKKDIQTKYIVK